MFDNPWVGFCRGLCYSGTVCRGSIVGPVFIIQRNELDPKRRPRPGRPTALEVLPAKPRPLLETYLLRWGAQQRPKNLPPAARPIVTEAPGTSKYCGGASEILLGVLDSASGLHSLPAITPSF